MYRWIVFLVLAVAGLGILLWPEAAWDLAGYKPLKPISAAEIDDPSAFDERDAPRFFAERNVVDLEVPRQMTVGELLRLYQIDFPHVRRQLAEQKGVVRIKDDDVLAAGERLRLTLTPPAEGVP